MRHNLFLGIVITPYRTDLCNYLYEHDDCEIYHLHRRLDDACFSEDYCSRIRRFEQKYLETRTWMGRKFIRLSCLLRLLKEHKPDRVYVPELSLTAFSVLLLRWCTRARYQVISICDDNPDMLGGGDLSRFHTLARRFMPRWLDNLVLTNPSTVKWYRDQFGKGVFFPIIADEKRLRTEMEAALPVSERLLDELAIRNKKRILYVGRLIDVKNLERLITAMPSVEGDAVLILVGDGVERRFLEMLAADSPQIIFTGKKSGTALLAWYNVADVLVLPSISEAFGAVVNEALAGGCPVAVSERAGSAFLVEEGRNGTVFNPESVEEIGAALNRLLSGTVPGNPVRLRNSLMPLEFLPTVEKMLSQL